VAVLLECIEGVEVVGEAGSAAEAVHLCEEADPTLVVLDPDLESGESTVCQDLKALASPPRVLIYSAKNSREAIASATLAGADSYVHKEASAQMLPEAILRTCNGERVWMLGPTEAASEISLRAKIEAARLTPKEKETLILLLKRRTNQEIAEKLHVSINTVRTHVKNIMREVGVENRRVLLEVQAAA
jgi:DNA-binding NarL/FixJ family response regulator